MARSKLFRRSLWFSFLLICLFSSLFYLLVYRFIFPACTPDCPYGFTDYLAAYSTSFHEYFTLLREIRDYVELITGFTFGVSVVFGLSCNRA